jgi:hypothetical protein
MQILLDFGAICFKFHDRINQRLISYQSAIPEPHKAISIFAHHDDPRSFAQIEISVLDRREGLTSNRTHGQQTNT